MTREDGKILKIGSPSQLPFAQRGKVPTRAYVLGNGTLGLDGLGWDPLWQGGVLLVVCKNVPTRQMRGAKSEREGGLRFG